MIVSRYLFIGGEHDSFSMRSDNFCCGGLSNIKQVLAFVFIEKFTVSGNRLNKSKQKSSNCRFICMYNKFEQKPTAYLVKLQTSLEYWLKSSILFLTSITSIPSSELLDNIRIWKVNCEAS